MTYSQKRNIILAGIIFLTGILVGGNFLIQKKSSLPNITNNPNLEFYQVDYVIDGDTFKLADNQRVRLLSINAPEKNECYYQESRQALQDLVEGKQVQLEKDILEKDQYLRLLRYAILFAENPDDSNILINYYLVRNGFAWRVPSPPNNRYRDLLSTAQEQAKKEKLGLWGACNYETDNKLGEKDSKPSDPNCVIKGNISEKGYGKTYLIKGCDNYETVKIDTRKGEQYFCTEKEAESAGFRKAKNCP